MKNGPYEMVVAPPDYPGTLYRGRYVYEHQLVWWQHTGQVVPGDCTIHHVNGKKRDNRFENFELLTRAKHTAEHANPTPMAITTCGWCKQRFSLPLRVMNTRFRQTKSGWLFCSRSHQVQYQHHH